MSAQGATLQNYNNELVKCIEDLREKREELNKQIMKEEEDKGKIQKELSLLTDRLQKSWKVRSARDRTIRTISNHSNHSNSFKIGIFRNFSLENSRISENFNIF